MKKDCRKKAAADAKGGGGALAIKGEEPKGGGKNGDWNKGGWQRKGGTWNPKGFGKFSKGDWGKGGGKGGKNGLMSLVDGDANPDYSGWGGHSWGFGGDGGGCEP